MSERGSMPDQIVPADLASVHLQAIARRWWLVAVAALVAGAVAYYVSSQQQKLYDATALVLLDNNDPASQLLKFTSPPAGDPERDLNTQVALVRLESTARVVRAQLGLDLTPDELLNEVSAGPQGTSNLIGITARDPSPGRAAAVADAFAARYVVVLQDQARAAYADAANQARDELRTLSAVYRRGTPGRSLRLRERQLRVAASLQTGDARIVSRASPPATPASPRPKFAAAVGVFFGTLIGALAAVALGAFKRRPRAEALAAPLAESAGNGHVDNADIVLPAEQGIHTAATARPDTPER